MAERDLVATSSDIKSDLQWFLDNLNLQLDDVALLQRGVELKFLWDTVDIQRAVLGMADFYEPTGPFVRKRFEDRKTLVCCLAAAGWLGNMKLLAPHQAELSTSLQAGFYLMQDQVPPGGADQFFRDIGFSGPKELTLKSFHAISSEEKARVVSRYAGEAERLFKALQNVRGGWKERLVSMYMRNLIDLRENEPIRYEEIFDDPMFEGIRRFFDRRRPTRRVNNFTDATCICLLRNQVEEFKSGRSTILPRFFDSSALFRDALANTNNLDSLCYKSSVASRVCVLRDTDYYIFRATFNPPPALAGRGPHKNLIESLTSVRDKVRQILDASAPLTSELLDEIAIDDKPLRTVIRELKQYSFLEMVWLPYAARETLSEVAVDYMRRVVELGSNEEFKDSVSDAIEEVRRALDANARECKWLSGLWRDLEVGIDRFQRGSSFPSVDPPDVFQEFALLRFGVPADSHDQVRQIVHSIVAGQEEDTRRALTALFRASRDAKHKRHEELPRTVAMCVLWVLGLDLVIQDIAGYEDDDPSWLLGIASASAIRIGLLPAAVRPIKELRKRFAHCPDPETKGQMAVTLAYLCFHLWHASGGRVKWRTDRNMPTQESQHEIDKWMDRAIKFAREAYLAKHSAASTKAYALNLHVCYVTEGGENKEFGAIKGEAEELMSCRADPGVWQYRFDDTLARYFHRRSTLADSIEDKKQFLSNAKSHISEAKKRASGDPLVEAYHDILLDTSVVA